jgi:hypothetical protein
MPMNKLLRGIVTLFLNWQMLHANPMITIFLRQYPADEEHAQEISESLQRPGKLARYTLHATLEKEIPSGIFATYAGFLGVSNTVGQLSFPRKQENPSIYLIVTEQATPIMMAGNTIHHWELDPTVPAEMYRFDQKRDAETQLDYWNVEKVDLPENNIIPLESILLFIKPKNIFIPTGITLSRTNANLILPDIYVKKGAKIYPSTLYVLNLKHFFGQINYLYEKRDNGYTTLIKNY